MISKNVVCAAFSIDTLKEMTAQLLKLIFWTKIDLKIKIKYDNPRPGAQIPFVLPLVKNETEEEETEGTKKTPTPEPLISNKVQYPIVPDTIDPRKVSF